MNFKYILSWPISTEIKSKTFTLFCISHHIKNPIEFTGHMRANISVCTHTSFQDQSLRSDVISKSLPACKIEADLVQNKFSLLPSLSIQPSNNPYLSQKKNSYWVEKPSRRKKMRNTGLYEIQFILRENNESVVSH